MHYRLDLHLRPAEGALLRVLGITEHRGFAPVALQGTQQTEQGWRLSVTVASERSPDSLKLQLQKLYDCLSVDITPVQSMPATGEA